jgi:ABC-type Fe3+/spermidine/putrescine transport system ATPase subunit
MHGLSATDVRKRYASTRAVDGVSFDVPRGGIFAVLGPSGCGKSTLLELIAGLTPLDGGEIRWDDRRLTELPPHRRGFGLMFQDLALFPHMGVFDNVAFGLKMAGGTKGEIRKRVGEVLRLVDMAAFAERDVNTLSGGEQQRIALARALAPAPRLLMLDEPLGSLDRALRERLLIELHGILKEIGQTAIYVTHDQEEAFALADTVAIMRAGRFLQVDAPQAIYRRPKSVFVARFLGMTNILDGSVFSGDGRMMARTTLGEIPIPDSGGDRVHVLLRPDAARIGGEGEIHLVGIVLERSFRGGTYRAVIQIDGERLSFDFPFRTPVPPAGEKVQLSLDPEAGVQLLEA